MERDELDRLLLEAFDGKVVRKDLLHRIKKGTNVPTFVLEFLLARYCASDEPEEIQAGLEAVIATLQDNYVRPDEANAAQSKVATKGKHRFIDKIHVRYVEKEKRHWAALENFSSNRVAIPDRFYRTNERLLEGGIWAEVTIAHNEVDEDDYAFYVEQIRPIQLSRFDFEDYVEGRRRFTRDQWLDVVLRSVGLEGSKLTPRQKLHFMARLIPLVEANFNFIELGPRGTGKSYFFSEFSPYSTLVSGGQATGPILFYNNARQRIGLVGYWDTVAFDEVGNVKIKDPAAIQIMKDYLANGRFSRGVEVIADASMAFVGNIDHSIQQVVNSAKHDLFMPLPAEFDLAVMDRLAFYLPGWEMLKNSTEYLTMNYGLITDFLAEAFHYQFSHTNRYEEVSRRIKLGKAVEGRDEKGIKKTVCGLLKILHPEGPPSDSEFDEYVAYAIEGRRRVKEQMNKRKPDDEFAKIDLSYVAADGAETIVYCPESKRARATQEPQRRSLGLGIEGESEPAQASDGREAMSGAGGRNGGPAAYPGSKPEAVSAAAVGAIEDQSVSTVEAEAPDLPPLSEEHYTIRYGDRGHTYESIVGPYLRGVREVVVEDPYIRATHQIQNFVRFCEAVLKHSTVKKIRLVTSRDDQDGREAEERLAELKQSLLEADVVLEVQVKRGLHDREIQLDNGWVIKIGRGLDFYQKPESWFSLGANDMSLRPCLETKVDIFRN